MKPQTNHVRLGADLPASLLLAAAMALVASTATDAATLADKDTPSKQAAPPKQPAAAPAPPSKPREQAPAQRAPERPAVKPPANPIVRPAEPRHPQQRPTEQRPTEQSRPQPNRPEPRKPIVTERDDRPIVVKPREDAKPVVVPTEPRRPEQSRPEPRKPIVVKPREDPKPVVVPSEPRRPEQNRPEPRKPIVTERDDRPIVVKPREDSKPVVTERDEVKPATRRPGTAIIEPTKPREDRDRKPEPRAERPMPKKPMNPAVVERGTAIDDRADDLRGPFDRDAVHGVPVARPAPRAIEPAGNRRHDRDDDDRDCPDRHDRYVRNVARCNGWWYGARWSDCGPCYAWQPYHCDDGVRISVGFGSGFSFGFFYGTSCAPLCSSWCNPWWDGYATWWSCRPTWSWHTAWCRPWYSCWSAYSPCPLPAWTPCYAYSPVVYRPVVYTTPIVVAPQPVVPNPDAMWAFLADGYDRDAEDGFILLEAAEPSDQRWVIGQAVARAFRGDTDRAATLLRSALAHDPSALMRLSQDPKFIARLEALERTLAPLVQAPRPSTDALVVVAASQAARGALSGAYLDATTASDEGDHSAGTANLVSWLRAELRRAP